MLYGRGCPKGDRARCETSMASVLADTGGDRDRVSTLMAPTGSPWARHERHVRDLLGMPIVGGSSNMQRNNIANRLGLRDLRGEEAR